MLTNVLRSAHSPSKTCAQVIHLEASHYVDKVSFMLISVFRVKWLKLESTILIAIKHCQRQWRHKNMTYAAAAATWVAFTNYHIYNWMTYMQITIIINDAYAWSLIMETQSRSVSIVLNCMSSIDHNCIDLFDCSSTCMHALVIHQELLSRFSMIPESLNKLTYNH